MSVFWDSIRNQARHLILLVIQTQNSFNHGDKIQRDYIYLNYCSWGWLWVRHIPPNRMPPFLLTYLEGYHPWAKTMKSKWENFFKTIDELDFIPQFIALWFNTQNFSLGCILHYLFQRIMINSFLWPTSTSRLSIVEQWNNKELI